MRHTNGYEIILIDFKKMADDDIFLMLSNRFPEQAIMAEWKQDIFRRLKAHLTTEGFTDVQINQITKAVWEAFGI